MNLLEHQAKELLADAGLPVPRGRVVRVPADLEAALANVPGPPWVLKAQVKAGGRGKAGGVRVVSNPAEALAVTGALLGKPLVTPQTGPEGVLVRKLLVEPAAKIARELYLGILIDRAAGAPLVLASAEGGVEIERLARETPEKLLRLWFDARAGLLPYQAREIALFLGLTGKAYADATKVFPELSRFFLQWDCSLLEVNPLVVTADDRLVLLDAKIGLDDNALARQPGLLMFMDDEEENPLERQAAVAGLSYISLPGSVGCMVNGAGLAMGTLDLLQLHGGMPANFLDVGGGATKDTIVAAFRILLSDPKVRSVLVNIFGGIMRCDVIAQGMIAAFQEIKPAVPVVVRLEGTNKDEGMRLLNASGLALRTAAGFDEAARLAV
ncbi:MAG: ADP-forming succinate--CoA ligase subunit beta, partial [bacterium]